MDYCTTLVILVLIGDRRHARENFVCLCPWRLDVLLRRVELTRLRRSMYFPCKSQMSRDQAL
jgi:hypothetical protein